MHWLVHPQHFALSACMGGFCITASVQTLCLPFLSMSMPTRDFDSRLSGLVPSKIPSISLTETAEAVDQIFQHNRKWHFNNTWVCFYNVLNHRIFLSNKSALSTKIIYMTEKNNANYRKNFQCCFTVMQSNFAYRVISEWVFGVP